MFVNAIWDEAFTEWTKIAFFSVGYMIHDETMFSNYTCIYNFVRSYVEVILHFIRTKFSKKKKKKKKKKKGERKKKFICYTGTFPARQVECLLKTLIVGYLKKV